VARCQLVEIERPQDALFTRANDHMARFAHAFGQVVDFLHWVGDTSLSDSPCGYRWGSSKRTAGIVGCRRSHRHRTRTAAQLIDRSHGMQQSVRVFADA